MSTNDNKELVRRYVHALDARDVASATALVAEDLVNHSAIPEAQGAAGLRRILGKLVAAFPDMRVSCEDLFAEGDRVVCRLQYRGTHTGALELVRLPLPATGKAVKSEVIYVFRVATGKVVEMWAGRDDLGVLRQLGKLPAA